MRVEVFSDHGGQQLQHTQERLRTAQAEVTVRQTSYHEAQDDLRSTRRAKPAWKRLLAVSTPAERAATAHVKGSWLEILHADQSRQAIHHRAHRQAAGIYGEDVLAWALSVLPDDWVMLRGYRNRRGETDHVLVGPNGVWVVEVKRRRVRLHVVGEQWWYEKLDARGRAVETEWAHDGGGRTWGRQAAEVASDLEAWLRRNGHEISIQTAVMLMHEKALLGRCEDVAVSLIGTHPEQLLRALANEPPRLTNDDREDIVELIRRDHRFHEKRRLLA
jgi:hypothetical protein